jgi:hypothetical protein
MVMSLNLQAPLLRHQFFEKHCGKNCVKIFKIFKIWTLANLINLGKMHNFFLHIMVLNELPTSIKSHEQIPKPHNIVPLGSPQYGHLQLECL